MVALKSIMLEFGRRLARDPTLQPLFQEVPPQVLTAHQERFFALALTEVNVANASMVIRAAHHHLFAKGLCEKHFDAFTHHFAGALTDRGFGSIVDQALEVLAPLRDIFEEASGEFQQSQSDDEPCKIVAPTA